MLVSDFLSVVTLFERLAHLHEAGEQRNERSSAVILGDSRPVAGCQLHGSPEPLDPDPDHIVITPLAWLTVCRHKARPPLCKTGFIPASWEPGQRADHDM